MECVNKNYLADSSYFSTWLLNTYTETTYQVLYLSYTIGIANASQERALNYAIYIDNSAISLSGDGTEENPYIIK